ncbi:hypothetical protein ACOBQJ_03605 [Pelotomaculum propionicicum]|uniref:hypothetical protein n=1 Tax=Pelotomaculum propionicicum TaxID=258475 RepID=UPI003B779E07
MSKAWLVSDGYLQTIIFAKTKNQAISAFEPNCTPSSHEVTAKREKKYDQYAEKGCIPVTVLLDDDWFVCCSGCFEPVVKHDLGMGALIKSEREALCESCAGEGDADAEESMRIVS